MMIISESTTSNVSQFGTENCGISGSENCTLENVASSYLIGTPLVISGQTPMVIGNVTSATLEHDLVPRAVLECKRAGPAPTGFFANPNHCEFQLCRLMS